MKATRARIDTKLDALQARLSDARGRANRAAATVAAGIGALLMIGWAGQRWHRRRALAAIRVRPHRRRPPVS
jgi:hypothetical protein